MELKETDIYENATALGHKTPIRFGLSPDHHLVSIKKVINFLGDIYGQNQKSRI